MDYKSFTYKINNNYNFELTDYDNTVILMNKINKPKSYLGFNTYFHRTTDTFERYRNNDELKEHIYYVVNPFESDIKHEEDLFNQSKKLLKIDEDEPNILKQSFYSLWEIIKYFDLCSKDKLTFASIGEGTGVSIQTIIKFREYNNINISQDKYFTISINEEDNYGKKMSEQLLGYYNNKYNDLINVHETKPFKKSHKLKTRSNGDITNLKTLSLFKKDIKRSGKYCDLVMGMGSFKTDIKTKEQLSYGLILGEIIGALRVQAKHGSFVLRIFETFTDVSLKLIYIMSQYYNDVYITKPLFSRNTEQDKYIVFRDFKLDQKKDKKNIEDIIKSLEEVLESMSSNEFVFDIYSDLELQPDFIDMFKYINIELANKQYNLINEIVNYIKAGNYFGDEHHEYKNNQIETNQWWINKFLKDTKNNLNDELKQISNYNLKEKEQFIKNLV